MRLASEDSKTRIPEILAIDIGGTKIAAGIVSFPNGVPQVSAQRVIATNAPEGGERVLDRVLKLVMQYRSGFDETSARTDQDLGIAGIAIASAGVISVPDGRVLSATSLMPGWAGIAIQDVISKATSLPVAVLNDVIAHGIGEAVFGAASQYQKVLAVALGTGMGGAIIVSGEPLLGAHSAAGHVGHLPHPAAAGYLCSCGTETGHIESIASGTGLVEYFNRAAESAQIASVASGKEFQRLVDCDHPVAIRVLKQSATALGQTLAGIAHVIDPDVIVLSGSVTKSGQLWWQTIRDSYRSDALPVFKDVSILQGQLDGDAPLIGAAHFLVTQKGITCIP